MVNATLETYLQTARNRGMSEDEIWAQFLEMGWSESEIAAVMLPSQPTSIVSPDAIPSRREQPVLPLAIPSNKRRSTRNIWIWRTVSFITAFILGIVAAILFVE